MTPGSPAGADPDLINDDLAPTPAAARTWSATDMAALWIGMVVCVPSYMLAGGLIELGMSWGQAVATVGLGNLIVLVPMILVGHAGTRYGIPFPVLARASFGIRGAHLPAIARGGVAAGWFGIQTWIGGSAIYQLAGGGGAGEPPVDLPVLGISIGELAAFLAFWAIQLAVLWRGMEALRKLEKLAAPFLVALALALLAWAWLAADGFGPMLATPSEFGPGGAREGELWRVFFPALTGMVGFWATLSLNIPDFTRFARDQRAQIVGQAVGLPLSMTLFAFVGVAVTSATVVIFGEAVPDPVALAGRLGGGATVALSLGALSLATLSTNLAANVVSPANALVNLAPGRVSFRAGAAITAGLGLAVLPWKLIETTSGYIFTWLVGYSALLGPIGGILVADYYLVRQLRLDSEGLYRRRGPYWYRAGFNPRAMVALAAGVLPNVPGFLAAAGFVASVPPLLSTLYAYAWFTGFAIAACLYALLMRLAPPGGSALR